MKTLLILGYLVLLLMTAVFITNTGKVAIENINNRYARIECMRG